MAWWEADFSGGGYWMIVQECNIRSRRFCVRVFITGATGFVGSHLADYLVKEGHEVNGLIRPRSREEFVNKEVDYHEGDIADASAMIHIIQKVKPDLVFHLAAQSYVPLSWVAPEATLSNNITGTLNILEAARKGSPNMIVQIAGSSEEYGFVRPEECPVTEHQPLRPFSPYGVSKVASDLLGQQYHKSYGIKTVITRAFNHTGPRRGEIFICSKIAKRLVLCEKEKSPLTLRLGNTDAVRDFTDVRDIIKAYWLAANKCKYGEPYNIGSGVGHTIKKVVEMFGKMLGKEIRTEQNPDMMRPSDVPYLICNSTKFRNLTGWKPEIPFEQTLEDLLDYWREKR